VKDKKSKKTFALKLLSVDSNAKPTKQVEKVDWNLHPVLPGLTPYFEAFKIDNKTYYIMSLMTEETLENHIDICKKSNSLFKFAV
jgi:serine/threonine protein kinase